MDNVKLRYSETKSYPTSRRTNRFLNQHRLTIKWPICDLNESRCFNFWLRPLLFCDRRLFQMLIFKAGQVFIVKGHSFFLSFCLSPCTVFLSFFSFSSLYPMFYFSFLFFLSFFLKFFFFKLSFKLIFSFS